MSPFINPLTAAQVAAALGQTTLTVTGQVTTTNPTTPTTPGGDEDEMRVYTQAQVDALTASDKTTNFTIWNTTTNAANYVVNGEVKVPLVSLAKTPTFGTSAIPSTSLPTATWTTFTVTGLPTNGNRVTFGVGIRDSYGVLVTTGRTTPAVVAHNFGGIQLATATSDGGRYTFDFGNASNGTNGVSLRNPQYAADGTLSFQLYASTGFTTAGPGNTNPNAVVWIAD